MQVVSHSQPIDRLTAAESVIELLGRLDVEKLPSDEQMAVATVQIEAIDAWLAAYLDVGTVRRCVPRPRSPA